MEPTLSYCVVNTNGGRDLLACLDSIRRTSPPGIPYELLVLDNASEDGSLAALRARPEEIRLIALDERRGKAQNDTTLLSQAAGRYCMLLNEDSELADGAAGALLAALKADPGAAIAGPQLLDRSGREVPCAWRFPGVLSALAGALYLHRLLTVQSRGGRTREVDWVQSSAVLVRRAASQQVDYLDPAFFVYYDECDFCKRLRDRGWRVLYVPAARATHEDKLAQERSAGLPRIVEFHRNRDLYMRKHHSRVAAAAVRLLTAWIYALRALAALVLPAHPAGVYAVHARQALNPSRGEGLRDRAARYNRESSSRTSASISSGTAP